MCSEHPSARLALNEFSWREALGECVPPAAKLKSERHRMRVVLAQDSFTLTMSASDLGLKLAAIPLQKWGTPAAYWPLSVGVL